VDIPRPGGRNLTPAPPAQLPEEVHMKDTKES
jgi:hypothetical protein